MTVDRTDAPPPSHADLEALVARCVAVLRCGPGKVDEYFELVEADHAVIPLLVEAFHAETNRGTRALLVDAIWEHRTPTVLEFLGEALADPDPPVWKNALDGFVALGTPDALDGLRAARARLAAATPPDAERLQWLDEAVEQIAGDLEAP
ncbi:MAG: HEAT repeat domain-containing protein [Deltaproteobacteria bacterium]|nr:HEAT repeat domain-containing protein [Deltaproteobacteria bacterium]